MISHQIITKASAGSNLSGLDSYYADAKDDYYAKDDKHSQWQGKLAHELGLSGNVKKADFLKLLTGKDPKTDEQLRQDKFNTKNARTRLAIDLTFSAPKSVSIESLVKGKIEVMKAHEQAVTKTLRLIEQKAQTRQKQNGSSETQTTGKLAIAKFRHETNRNSDPQLHTHALVINLTQRQDGQYRALHNDEIIKNTKAFTKTYQSYLAKELKNLGYDLRITKDGFELAHINQKQINAFSSRSQEIEAELAKQGLTRETASTHLKQKITLNTRQAKQHLDKTEIHKQWTDKAQQLGIIQPEPRQKHIDTFDTAFNFDKFEGGNLHDTPSLFEDFKDISQSEIVSKHQLERWQVENAQLETPEVQRNEELYVQNQNQLKQFVIEHLTDKTHVFTQDDLKKTLLEKGLGLIDHDDLIELVKDIEADDSIIKTDAHYKMNGKLMTEQQVKQLTQTEQLDSKTLNQFGIQKINAVYTTQKALSQDKAIIDYLRESQQQIHPVYSELSAKQTIEKTTLNLEQAQCAQLILTSQDAVIGIQGYAGTGKSFMVSQTRTMLEQAGKEMHLFAPYASQVKNLKADGLEANTVASLLLSKEMQAKINKDSVIMIDEAGVINSAQMLKILQLRAHTGCQLVLLGDTAQTKAVEAGTPFELLQKQGMPTAYMTDIQRQKNQELLQAVKSSVQGHQPQAIAVLKQHGVMHEHKTMQQRHQAIVQQYSKLDNETREKTLIVAGTHKARASLNDQIREELGRKGQGLNFTQMQSIDRTKAELNHAINFDQGDYVCFSKATKKLGLSRNQDYLILERDPKNNTLTVLNDQAQAVHVKVSKGLITETFKAEQMELSVGDQVRITQTNKRKGLATGDLFEVKQINIDTGTAYAEDKTGKGYTFDLDEKHHFDYAYAMTVHASQGLTYDHVICDLNTKSQTLSQETFYVAISRARYGADIYTDSIRDLPSQITKTATKENAIELIQQENPYKTPQEAHRATKPHQDIQTYVKQAKASVEVKIELLKPYTDQEKKERLEQFFSDRKDLAETFYKQDRKKLVKTTNDLVEELKVLKSDEPSKWSFIQYKKWQNAYNVKFDIYLKNKDYIEKYFPQQPETLDEKYYEHAQSELQKKPEWSDIALIYKDVQRIQNMEKGIKTLEHQVIFKRSHEKQDFLEQMNCYLKDPENNQSFENTLKHDAFKHVPDMSTDEIKDVVTKIAYEIRSEFERQEQKLDLERTRNEEKDWGDNFSL